MAVRHILTILATSDIERAVAFYDAAFGWDKSVDVPVYVEYDAPGCLIGIYKREAFAGNVAGQVPLLADAGSLLPCELYFRSDDLEADLARIIEAGAIELSPLQPKDWGDEAAYFRDPDGNVIVLARPLPTEDNTHE